MAATIRGHFLIAGPRLKDPNFFKAAVLLVEHNDEGAMGLVINRPSSVTVANALAGHFELPQASGFVYQAAGREPPHGVGGAEGGGRVNPSKRSAGRPSAVDRATAIFRSSISIPSTRRAADASARTFAKRP